MNWQQIEGKWHEYKGRIKQRWGKLTDQDLTVIDGKERAISGKSLNRPSPLKDRPWTAL